MHCMHGQLLGPALVWGPLYAALLYASWTDIRRGIIPDAVPLWILFWSVAMRCACALDLHVLSALGTGLFLASLYAYFWSKHHKRVLGGGDLKLILACALIIPPIHLGPWIGLMGLWGLITSAVCRSPAIPLAPAIALGLFLIRTLL